MHNVSVAALIDRFNTLFVRLSWNSIELSGIAYIAHLRSVNNVFITEGRVARPLDRAYIFN